eukprot:m.394217 g.394217  ORF g.394217 m.394217 type:complete len:69 (-) comp20096_c3_seq2:563-769(-)
MAAVGAARASTRSKLKCDDAKEMLFAHTEAELDVLDRVRDFAFRVRPQPTGHNGETHNTTNTDSHTYS